MIKITNFFQSSIQSNVLDSWNHKICWKKNSLGFVKTGQDNFEIQ